MSASTPEGYGASLDHVLILAPYRRDADYLCRLLAENEIRVDPGSGAEELERWLAASPGVLVATHEAITPAVLTAVADHLQSQPPWSELPVIVLLDRMSSHLQIRDDLRRAWPRARQLFYQRPVTSVELLSGVQSALLSRLRQRALRDYIERETELRRELNHRVKNILASVNSIFEMTRRAAGSLDELTDHFRGRLGALAQVHSTVFQADDESVSIDQIVELTFKPYAFVGEERVVSNGPPVTMTGEAGTTLALCLHELATNAIKYGALSVPQGKVHFEWTVSSGDHAELSVVWRETGGPAVQQPSRVGYGTRYLRSAFTSLFGEKPTVVFKTDGLDYRVKGLLSRVAPSHQNDTLRS